MKISSHLQKDFTWWLKVFSTPGQSNRIRSGPFAREIFSDASLNGWGASCSELRTHGWWSEEDKTLHINSLELKAAYNALRCFAADLHSCDILLRIDNTTAIAYINKFGSVQHPHLAAISRQIWRWCEDRDIFIFASYISSIENSIADAESRIADPDTEWALSDEAFGYISSSFGPFERILRFLVPGSGLYHNRCLYSVVEGSKLLRLPTVHFITASFEKVGGRRSSGHSGRALVALSGLVPAVSFLANVTTNYYSSE